MKEFQQSIEAMPLIAVLRGLTAREAKDVGAALVEGGFTVLEVPVRSKTDGFSTLDKEALESLRILIDQFGDRAHITAGTVRVVSDIATLKTMGVTTALAPNFSPAVVAEAKKQNVKFIPGVETLSEAVGAMEVGAFGLKLFPCIVKDPVSGAAVVRHSPGALKVMRDFVPLPIYPSGGLNGENLGSYLQAGAAGINIGGELYAPGRSVDDIRARAQQFTAAVKKCKN